MCTNRIRGLVVCGTLGLAILLVAGVYAPGRGQSNDGGASDDESKIQIGYAIAPVPLNLVGKNRALVGLGSYIVNAHADCNACHTWHNFVPGGNPYLGQPEQINTAHYLAGGRSFPPNSPPDTVGDQSSIPVVSRNLTPDPTTGLPANLTFDQFRQVLRTGVDFDHCTPGFPVLQVMPWPEFQNMTDRDIAAIYEYLSAIPHAEPAFPIPCG